MKNTTKLRNQIKDAIDTIGREHGWPVVFGRWSDTFQISVRDGTATVAWAGLPEPQVIGDALAGLDTPVELEHRWAWSDGMFWDDSRSAYIGRHGSELEVIEYDGCCGHCEGHTVKTAEDAYDELGYEPDPGVVAGRFVGCPAGCRNGLVYETKPKFSTRPCAMCADNAYPGVFNLDNPDEAARFWDEYPKRLAAAWAERDKVRPDTVPSIDEWLAANPNKSTKAAITWLLRRDKVTLTRWLNDPKSR